MREKRLLQERSSSARVASNTIDDDVTSPEETAPSGLYRTPHGKTGPSMRNSDKMACCNQCKQPLTKIDNYGERLTGCLTCNLWATA